MVKPPRTMQPERFGKLEKAGRSSTKSFSGNSFHNYMARKISLQRQQFGLQLPPPLPASPPPPTTDDLPTRSKHHRSVMRKTQRYSSPSRGGECSCIPGNTPSPFRVRFATGSKLGAPDVPTTRILRSRRREKRSLPKAAGMDGMLRRLKKRHGKAEETGGDYCDDLSTDCFESTQNDDSDSDPTTQQLISPFDRKADEDESNLQLLSHGASSFAPAQQGDQVGTTNVSPSLKRSAFTGHPDLFFTGIVVMVNGDTNPDTDTLQRLLHRHGGDLEKYETSRVTHIIAEHLSFAKAKMYKSQRRPRPVAYPTWILDSIAAKRLLPVSQYLLDEFRREGETPQASVNAFFQPAPNINSHQNSKKREFSTSLHTTAEVDETCNSLHQLMDKGNVPPLQDTPPLQSEDEADSLSQLERTRSESNHLDQSLGRQDDVLSEQIDPKLSSSATEADQLGPSPVQLCSSLGMLFTEGTGVDALDSVESRMNCIVERDYPDRMTNGGQTNVQFHAEPKTICADKKIDERTQLCTSSESCGRVTGYTSTTAHAVPERSRLRTDEKFINGTIRTVGTDPDFLSSFFRNSRLSYIGSFKQRRNNRSDHRVTCTKGNSFVFHIDMDCFFAAVVLRKFPQYVNLPVVISHHGRSSVDEAARNDISFKNSTSECATCNYEARKYGIKKGMYLGRAKELCPSLVVLSYDFDGYQEVSSLVFDIISRVSSDYGGVVEEVSCDESYMEIRLESASHAAKLAEDMRAEIHRETECTATIGVAKNKFLAKLATDHVKPNRSFVVRESRELLRSLKLRDLHGIGYRSEPRLAESGFVTVQDVWDRGESSLNKLKQILGERLGTKIWMFCQGEDDRPIECAERKTIGAEASVDSLPLIVGFFVSRSFPVCGSAIMVCGLTDLMALTI